MLKRIGFVVVLLAIVVPSNAADQRDGNWWIKQSQAGKVNYMVGFFDGMQLGNEFSYWGFDKNTQEACTVHTIDSYSEYGEKYFSHVTNYQLVDGLDTFFADFRNRSITVSSAVWLVVNEIAGTPRETLDKMIEGWRRNAAKP
jgi:hypothetical protein